MKKLLLPILLVLLAMPVLAQASVLNFRSPGGEPFYLKLDGRTVNHKASTFVCIPNILPGKHYVEFKIMGRRGVHRLGSKVFLNRGVEANYVLHVADRRGKARLQLASQVPLMPPPVVVVPPPPVPKYKPVPPRYDRDPVYCRNLLTRQDLDRLAAAMKSRSFESTRLTIARDAVRSGSIVAEDLKFILEQFDYESTRVEFAKFAYDYVCDREHFYYVYEAFTFDSSIRELEEYNSGRR